jgi:hypothetical protein
VSVFVIRDGGNTTRFDIETDTWTVTAADGHTETARVLLDTRPSGDGIIAVHGLPNYFRIPGPDTRRQRAYVDRCLDLLDRSGAGRIEARSRIVWRRWGPHPVAGRFYLTGSAPHADDLYDGPATVTLPAGDVEVRARLTGHLTAIDGQYHWRGTLSGSLTDDVLKGRNAVALTIGGQQVSARFAERSPWGGYTVTGVGVPPYQLT